MADWVSSQLYYIGIDCLIIEEAAKIRKIVWEQYLRPTLADRQGWALFTTTPEGYNWIYDLWQRGKSEEFPDWESWQHPSTESPYFKDDIEELKKTLTRETYEQEFLARHLRHFQVGSFRMTAPYTLENSSITQICPHTVVSISGTGQAQQDSSKSIQEETKIKST